MNVLLLYPKYPDTFWSFKHVMSFAGSKAAYPPLGLLTVASMLPSEWNKKLIDMNINELKDEDILEADIVFISAMIAQNNSAIETIERCKSLNRTVVAGGPLFMSHQQKFDQVDHLILGEGELTLPAFLKDFKAGTAKHVYRAEEFPDMSKTPLPMWSLINFKDYATMSVQYSRGCPFDCEFCDIVVMNGRVPRSKTPSQMINELEFLYKAGWRGRVFIVDDNFIGNKSKVIELLDVLSGWQKKHKYPFTFTTQTSIDLADNPELMQKMRDSFFQQVFIGIETPHYDSLNECGKKQNTRTNLEDSIKTINNYGILVMGGFIVGFDSDPKEIFESQINFIQRTGVVIAMVSVLSALPGTRLWERLKKDNRIVKEGFADNSDGSTNIIPLIRDRNELKVGYKKILSEIYSKKNYYKRIDNLLKNYRPAITSRLKIRDVSGLMKAVWAFGIMSKGERLLFWRIAMKTFFTKRKAFPDVITFIVLGSHFNKVTSKMTH